MWLWSTMAWGTTAIDRTIDASGEVVEVAVICGEVKIVGGARKKGVRVTGTIDDPDLLALSEDGDPFELLTLEESRSCARLVVEVPAGSSVEVSTRSASILVEGVTGPIEAESVSGDLSVRGAGGDLEAQTVSGSIRITGGERVELATVSGGIEAREVRGELAAASVSGSLVVTGAGLRAIELETVSGSIDLSGALAPDARIEASTHSGNVLARVPAALDARIELSTFSGRARSAFGAEPEHSAGGGRGRIELSSFSGDVTLEKAGAPGAAADVPTVGPPIGPVGPVIGPLGPPMPPPPPPPKDPPRSP